MSAIQKYIVIIADSGIAERIEPEAYAATKQLSALLPGDYLSKCLTVHNLIAAYDKNFRNGNEGGKIAGHLNGIDRNLRSLVKKGLLSEELRLPFMHTVIMEMQLKPALRVQYLVDLWDKKPDGKRKSIAFDTLLVSLAEVFLEAGETFPWELLSDVLAFQGLWSDTGDNLRSKYNKIPITYVESVLSVILHVTKAEDYYSSTSVNFDA